MTDTDRLIAIVFVVAPVTIWFLYKILYGIWVLDKSPLATLSHISSIFFKE